jgi:glycosyltransferase involved in cell wall biosynthesis
VAFAVRLVEKKGIPVVLAAAERAPELTFAIAGDGPLRKLLARVPSNVRWLGALDVEGMTALYRAADAVVLPSRGEGLPVFVQEAMACGLPAVVCGEEVYAGALVDARVAWGAPRSPGAFAARLREALASADAPARARIRDYALRHWSVERMIERHAAIAWALTGERKAR